MAAVVRRKLQQRWYRRQPPVPLEDPSGLQLPRLLRKEEVAYVLEAESAHSARNGLACVPSEEEAVRVRGG